MCNGREFPWLELCKVAWNWCNGDLILIKGPRYGQDVLTYNRFYIDKGDGGVASFKFKPSVVVAYDPVLEWFMRVCVHLIIFQFMLCSFFGWWVLVERITSPRGKSNRGLPKASSSQAAHGKFQLSFQGGGHACKERDTGGSHTLEKVDVKSFLCCWEDAHLPCADASTCMFLQCPKHFFKVVFPWSTCLICFQLN